MLYIIVPANLESQQMNAGTYGNVPSVKQRMNSSIHLCIHAGWMIPMIAILWVLLLGVITCVLIFALIKGDALYLMVLVKIYSFVFYS